MPTAAAAAMPIRIATGVIIFSLELAGRICFSRIQVLAKIIPKKQARVAGRVVSFSSIRLIVTTDKPRPRSKPAASGMRKATSTCAAAFPQFFRRREQRSSRSKLEIARYLPKHLGQHRLHPWRHQSGVYGAIRDVGGRVMAFSMLP